MVTPAVILVQDRDVAQFDMVLNFLKAKEFLGVITTTELTYCKYIYILPLLEHFALIYCTFYMVLPT